MSRTAITLKFKMCLFLDEATSLSGKLFLDINLPPLIPDEENNFGGPLVLDFKNDDVTCNPRIQYKLTYQCSLRVTAAFVFYVRIVTSSLVIIENDGLAKYTY